VNKLAIAVFLAAGPALQPVANAGAHYQNPVYIDQTSSMTYVWGSLYSASSSSDSNQEIGCFAEGLSGGSSTYLYCWAENAAGNVASCYMDNPPSAMLQLISGINSTSYVYFDFDTNGYQCLDIDVNNESANL
jgi:hypothetical protein